MYTIEFDIDSDGDFGYEADFTILIHEDKEVLMEKTIENLRKINKTFRTSRDYVKRINDCITRFLKAWDDPNTTSFFDPEYEDVWFVRDHEDQEFCFDLENGNQSIHIYEDIDVKVEKINGGFAILKK